MRYREKKVYRIYRKLHPTTVSQSVSSIEGNIEGGERAAHYCVATLNIVTI